MAEAFGILAGIISICQAVCESMTYVCEVNEAPVEIQMLRVPPLYLFRSQGGRC